MDHQIEKNSIIINIRTKNNKNKKTPTRIDKLTLNNYVFQWQPTDTGKRELLIHWK